MRASPKQSTVAGESPKLFCPILRRGAGSSGADLLTADSAQDERQAMPLAVEDLATRISSLISEGW